MTFAPGANVIYTPGRPSLGPARLARVVREARHSREVTRCYWIEPFDAEGRALMRRVVSENNLKGAA